MNREQESRWPPVVALLAICGINLALPASLVAGPRWLSLALVSVLLIPTTLARRRGRHDVNRILTFVVLGIVAVGLGASLVLLVTVLPAHKESPLELLRSAAALWLSNILLFALWYWRLDAGGPHQRDLRVGHSDGAFLFPQMTMTAEARNATGNAGWSPRFIDYLFLAFNTSTAFSPTDVPILSRWAKVLMMLQSIISLVIVVLLAARAVNIL
ncbi:MAG TPA: hypothetical protein VN610_03510 [Bryobacteraceae bacterium]|nr:hypothetical protein [Bryobacteraceae bacterium]